MSLILSQAADAQGGNPYLWWGIALTAVALVLFFIELLVPTGGLLALLCGSAAIGSVIAFFMHDTMVGVTALAVYAVGTPILLVFVFKVWLHSPLSKRMVLGGNEKLTESSEDNYRDSEKARTERLKELEALIGAEGVTISALRPVGFVRINGQRIDAMAEAGVIEANRSVIVTDVYDNQIKVRPT